MPAHFRHLLKLIYGCYAWLVVGVFIILAAPILLLLPTLQLRRFAAKKIAQVMLLLIGVRYQLIHQNPLPAGACVIVANHNSYIDGLLLKATLPARFSFVIKKEMVDAPIIGLLLKRIGAEFVDRTNRHSGASDARRLLRQAHNGRSLVFFPEGTFTHRVGLARFHLGAFVAAQQAQLPTTPITIHGARNILRPGSHWLQPGTVAIHVLPTLPPITDVKTRIGAEVLRTQARNSMLANLNEPDISTEQ